jgi:hypothetical protein
MNELSPTTSNTPPRLLSGERVRELLTREHPDYGRGFSEAEWEQITERLSALARLLWRISQRHGKPSGS